MPASLLQHITTCRDEIPHRTDHNAAQNDGNLKYSSFDQQLPLFSTFGSNCNAVATQGESPVSMTMTHSHRVLQQAKSQVCSALGKDMDL